MPAYYGRAEERIPYSATFYLKAHRKSHSQSGREPWIPLINHLVSRPTTHYTLHSQMLTRKTSRKDCLRPFFQSLSRRLGSLQWFQSPLYAELIRSIGVNTKQQKKPLTTGYPFNNCPCLIPWPLEMERPLQSLLESAGQVPSALHGPCTITKTIH